MAMSQYILFLMQMAGTEDDEISRALVADLQEAMDQTIDTPPQSTEINVFLDSPGGDAQAAYKLALDLRSRACKLRVLIPDFAKSAATMLAISCDEIYMAPAAELGPLDIQVAHPDRENVTISALDGAGALDFLVQAALELVIKGGGRAIRATNMTRQQVLGQFTEFASALLTPVMGKIDPQLTRRAAVDLELSRRYAVELLLRRKPAPQFTLTQKRAAEVAEVLVHGFPSHGYVIDPQVASRIGLPVFDLRKHWLGVKAKKLHGSLLKNPEAVESIEKTPLGPSLFEGNHETPSNQSPQNIAVNATAPANNASGSQGAAGTVPASDKAAESKAVPVGPNGNGRG